MSNNYLGFSPESFEQFARAMALSVFGPGVSAFGNGPDGGREATFRGEVPYPFPPASNWSGYGVIQAKFKERLESAPKDQKWALNQLRDELNRFVSSPNREPKPQYYVFVTNVELSSAANGGRERADEMIHSYCDRLPIVGHAVWDANQLDGLLSTKSEVRRRFLAHLTTGDVLGAILDTISANKPNAELVLVSFLERELRADEAARLDQAGNRTEEQLRLAHLFFDLPAAPAPQLVPPIEELGPDGRLPQGILSDLLRDGSQKLDPKTVYEQGADQIREEERIRTRYVLLGGPGSGKSTVGQFLAQIHRAALLSRREPYSLEPQALQIIKETEELCAKEGIPWPSTPRYPFRVELNRLAKALASKESDRINSLEGYLLNLLRREYSLKHEDLLEWLGAFPWLLILDGLDEVPQSANRPAVVEAVNSMLSQARQINADIFVVATSRQDGYNSEFASGLAQIRHILPLSRARALRYVESYANARFGAEGVRAMEVVERLRESTKRELTAQLMNSPLQVTFMCTVVAARGDPGEDRWQLFDSYYRTIYDRERQKAVSPYDLVLSKQQATIERLHHDIGFWLQYRGEGREDTQVSLSPQEFEGLVDEYLAEIGHEGPEKDRLVKLIADAARHRLVFLACKVEGELSFDVRSLQEYMAAECLMTGAPEIVKGRLKAIAAASYWRNVFLFAASKCFVDARSRHLQESIRILCEDMSGPENPLLEKTRSGSELAIDILQSGAVAENPNYARHLARTGLELIQEPYLTLGAGEGAGAARRLAAVYSEPLTRIFQAEMELRVGQSVLARTFGAWSLVAGLIGMGVGWAVELGEHSWPREGGSQLRILRSILSELSTVPWVRAKTFDAIWSSPPNRLHDVLALLGLSEDEPDDSRDPLHALRVSLWHGFGPRTTGIKFSDRGLEGIEVQFIPVFSEPRNLNFVTLSRVPRGHPGWLPFALADRFLRDPKRQTLASILDDCAEAGWSPSYGSFLARLPWPLANSLGAVGNDTELRALAQDVRWGLKGDTESWRVAERSWREKGISVGALIGSEGTRTLLNPENIGRVPGVFSWSISHRAYPLEALQGLFQLLEGVPPSAQRDTIFNLLSKAASFSGGVCKVIKASDFLRSFSKGNLWWSEEVIGFPGASSEVDEWLGFLEFVGNSDRLDPSFRLPPLRQDILKWSEVMQAAFIKSCSHACGGWAPAIGMDSRRLGLLRMLGRFASAGLVVEMIPEQVLASTSFADGRFRLAAILVRLSRPRLTPAHASKLADDIAALLSPPAEAGADNLVFRTVEAHMPNNPAITDFLLRLHETMPLETELGVARCEQLLRRAVARRPSDLQGHARLISLELPVVKPLQ